MFDCTKFLDKLNELDLNETGLNELLICADAKFKSSTELVSSLKPNDGSVEKYLSVTGLSVNTLDSTLNLKDQNHKMIDVTGKFFSACNLALKSGELMHNNWFTLQHAMSAIEVMDMKMDAYMECNRPVLTTLEAIHAGQLSLGPFSDLSELIGIMDELLSTLVNWLTGDSLAQSVFICMYMHCTVLIKDRYLHVFCEVLRRIVYQLLSLIMAVSVYDDDFFTSSIQMPIQNLNNVYTTLGIEFDLSLTKMTTIKLLNHIDQLAANIESDAGFSLSNKDLWFHLRTRLKFLHALFQFSNTLFGCINSTDIDLPQEVLEDYSVLYSSYSPRLNGEISNVVIDQISAIWPKLIRRCKSLSTCLVLLHTLSQNLIESAKIGKPAGRGKLEPNEFPYGLAGFEVFLNRDLLPSYMPRVVYIYDRVVSFSYYLDLFTRLGKINETFQLYASWHQHYPNSIKLNCLWAFIQNFGQRLDYNYFNLKTIELANPTRKACVLSRTIIYMLYFDSLHLDRYLDFKPYSLTTIHLECFINLWLKLVPRRYHSTIRNIIFQTNKLLNFFSAISFHLIKVSY